VNTKGSDIKKETMDHWSEVPIGTQTSGFSSGHAEFTKEYFNDHSRFRYDVYSPWLRGVARFSDFAGKSILEVGCGMGTDLLEYARGGAIVTGLDLTPRHLELARLRFRLFDTKGTFINGDAENLPFSDDSFDYVFSNGVLHHTPDTQKAVNEIYRVLKPEGEALIVLYHKNSLTYYLGIIAKSGTKRFIGHLLRGQSLRDFSLKKVLSASTDGEQNPLTKVFSRGEGASMMRQFDQVQSEIYHLNRGDFPFSNIVPRRFLERLSRSVGWYLVLRGRKRQSSNAPSGPRSKT
jgi:ubiquinone/menaquinone biosynthesis C-methylase UbiE